MTIVGVVKFVSELHGAKMRRDVRVGGRETILQHQPRERSDRETNPQQPQSDSISAMKNIIYTYLSTLCTLSADPNPFCGTRCVSSITLSTQTVKK